MPDTMQKIYSVDVGALLDDGSSDPGDVAHYIDQRGDQDVAQAMIEGTEVVALCGYRWVPFRDPQRKPICQPCRDELARIIQEGA